MSLEFQDTGFHNLEEYLYLTTAFSTGNEVEFLRWSEEDGTKKGLLALLRSSAFVGKWQKMMPMCPGCYYTASRDGLLCGTRVVYRDSDTVELKEMGSAEWEGWWWSVPEVRPDDLPPPTSDEEW